MGTVNHRVLVVIGPKNKYEIYKENGIEAAHKAAREESGALADLVSELTEGVVNNVATFVVATSGSKVGWADADNAEAAHARIVGRLEAMRYDDGSTACKWFVAEQDGETSEWRFVTTDSAGRGGA